MKPTVTHVEFSGPIEIFGVEIILAIEADITPGQRADPNDPFDIDTPPDVAITRTDFVWGEVNGGKGLYLNGCWSAADLSPAVMQGIERVAFERYERDRLEELRLADLDSKVASWNAFPKVAEL